MSSGDAARPAALVPPSVVPLKVRGMVDGFEGQCLTGWAIAEPDDHSCLIEVRDADGHTVATGRAARARSDLAGLGLGRTSFAFRIPLPYATAATHFTVTADGAELQRSPVPAGPGLFDGFFNVIAGRFEGWVTERCAAPEPPEISIHDDRGRVLAAARAVIDRSTGDPFFSPARFSIPVPAACIGRGPVELAVRANGAAVSAPVTVALEVDGALEFADALRCAGWLGARAAPDRRFALDVFRDGVKVGDGMADLGGGGRAAPREWNVGFDIALDPPEQPGSGHVIAVRLAGSDLDLFGGPFVVGGRGGLIATAREIARLVHGDLPGLDALGVDVAGRAVLQAALAEFIARTRHAAGPVMLRPARLPMPAGGPRLTVLIPVYRDVATTATCIESVLAVRDPARDLVLLIDDCSPDPEMAARLAGYATAEPGVTVLTNAKNLGFVRTVNRGFAACPAGDVLLLNSDTRLFPGAIDELVAVARGSADIGTVTALSNNATVFTYPVPDQPVEALADCGWEELAAVALAQNRGGAVEVPTGHGFCMLLARAMLDRVGRFNEAFGRGYGEENEFCQRGADLGFRHVAAAGVLVEHRERTSFGPERNALLRTNLPRLAAMYPEYNDDIRAFVRRDPLRPARWSLDRHRILKARAAAGRAVLVVGNRLGGGTGRAAREIAATVGYGGALVLQLMGTAADVELEVPALSIAARFAAGEAAALLAALEDCGIDQVLVHHLLGFPADAIAGLAVFARRRHAVAYVHDFHAICPRVTMIDATGNFCHGAPVAHCERCIALAGVHEASATADLSPAEHRDLFADLLGAMDRIIAPSADAAAHLSTALPGLRVDSIPHPHLGPAFPATARAGRIGSIALLGAIGPPKGSGELLALARRARITHPALRFHVIGYTDIDTELETVGNVEITGKYEDDELAGLIAAADAAVALFLHIWPETFSYTLSEAVAHGLIPVVPDLGAPAERVRAAGFGVVFPYPFDAVTVLDTLDGIAAGRIATARPGRGPANFAAPDAAARIAAALSGTGRSRRRRKA